MGEINDIKLGKLSKTMKAFAYLMEVYQVDDYMVCATSAMREAANAQEVIAKIKADSGIAIDVIDGQREADLIFSTFETQDIDLSQTYLYIDVGGGSTEITIFKNGEKLIDFYSNTRTTVNQGQVIINSEFDVVLLESSE